MTVPLGSALRDLVLPRVGTQMFYRTMQAITTPKSATGT